MIIQRSPFSLASGESLVGMGWEPDRGYVEALPPPLEALRRHGERFPQV